MLYKKCASLKNLKEVVKDIKNILPSSATIFLEGEVGAGKTTFVSNFAKIFGLTGITSPTFTLAQTYGDNIYHYDFYRINSSKIIDLGLINEFEKDGLHFIEWGDSFLKELIKNAGFKAYKLLIKQKNSCNEYILEELNEYS